MHIFLILLLLSTQLLFSYGQSGNNSIPGSPEELIDVTELIKKNPTIDTVNERKITEDELKEAWSQLASSASKATKKSIKERDNVIYRVAVSIGIFLATEIIEKIPCVQPFSFGITLCGRALYTLVLWEAIQSGFKVIKYDHKGFHNQVKHLLLRKRIKDPDKEPNN